MGGGASPRSATWGPSATVPSRCGRSSRAPVTSFGARTARPSSPRSCAPVAWSSRRERSAPHRPARRLLGPLDRPRRMAAAVPPAPRRGPATARFRGLGAGAEQLPDTVTMLANGVRAGLTLKQAVAQLVRDAPEPTAGELRPVERALALGVTLDAALDELLRRRPSDDLGLLVSAMSLHAQIGGNLARTLDSIAEALRERSRIQRDVLVLTSQQRYSAYVLAGLPIVVAIALYLVSPDYFAAMFAYAFTRIAVVLAAIMVVAGFVLIRAMAAVDV